MDQILEQKIKDLMVEAGRQGDWPVRAVLHMLLGAYNAAQPKKFARHCCRFSAINFQMGMRASDSLDDFTEAVGHNHYKH